ncbi:MAG: hypothetical protein CL607_18930 [Anaerolineaceae bacterium]|nr:hypothetical protein [Anaerolineaceae bacterium]
MSEKFSEVYEYQKVIDITLGSVAHVFKAVEKSTSRNVAIKIMWADHLPANTAVNGKNETPKWNAYITEAKALAAFSKNQAVMSLFNLGYMNLASDIGFIDSDKQVEMISDPEIKRYKKDIKRLVPTNDEIQDFVDDMANYKQRNWRPFFELEYLPEYGAIREYLNTRTVTHAYRFPAVIMLNVVKQVIDILIHFFENRFIYLDHKLSHYYWDQENERIRVIDFNAGAFIDDLTDPTTDVSTDVNEFVLFVVYHLITGDPPIEDNVAYSERDRTHKRELPNNLPSKTYIKHIFKKAHKQEYKTFYELLEDWKALLQLYGLSSMADPSAIAANQELLRQYGKASDIIEYINSIVEELKRANVSHEAIDAEFTDLRLSLAEIVDNFPLILK